MVIIVTLYMLLVYSHSIASMWYIHRHPHVQTYTRTCTHTHTRTHTRARAHTHTHALTHARTHTLAHARTHTHTHARTRTHTHNTIRGPAKAAADGQDGQGSVTRGFRSQLAREVDLLAAELDEFVSRYNILLHAQWYVLLYSGISAVLRCVAVGWYLALRCRSL